MLVRNSVALKSYRRWLSGVSLQRNPSAALNYDQQPIDPLDAPVVESLDDHRIVGWKHGENWVTSITLEGWSMP